MMAVNNHCNQVTKSRKRSAKESHRCVKKRKLSTPQSSGYGCSQSKQPRTRNRAASLSRASEGDKRHPQFNRSHYRSRGVKGRRPEPSSPSRLGRGKSQRQRRHRAKHEETPIFELGELVGGRYRVSKVLGEGGFGQVLHCKDKQRQDRAVAVKVIKQYADVNDGAEQEIRILEQLSEWDQGGTSGCLLAIDWFRWRDQDCIVLPLMGASVYHFIRENDYQPFPDHQVQQIVLQLCRAVEFLHSHRLTHTDLKPENMLFVHSAYDEIYSPVQGRTVRVVRDTRIRLIDFGTSTFEYKKHPKVVCTRHYRAPEVILELPWSHPIDVWSIGCIVYELVTGSALFMTHNTREHLAMMERAVGRQFPTNMVTGSKHGKRYFLPSGRVDWERGSSTDRHMRRMVKPLAELWAAADNRMEVRLALDLTKEMLQFDPKRRVTVAEALNRHPFFHLSMSETGSQSYSAE